jgi:DNA-binding LacI/PurR family transcriptional regulator
VPTLKEIAEQVGVSISTVSRVINGDKTRHIHAETKQKVWEAVQKLGYKPNESARKLVKKEMQPSRQSRQIGCIMGLIRIQHNHPYFSPMLMAIRETLHDLGYTLAYLHTGVEVRNIEMLHKLVHETPIEWMLIIGEIDPEIYGFIKRNVQTVVGIDIGDLTVPVVCYDKIAAGQAAVHHLMGKGHRKIGYIGGGSSGELEKEHRYQGYKRAMQEAGVPLNPDWIFNAQWNTELSYQLMKDFLANKAKELPTAIFAASDMMAIPAIRACQETGVRVPADIAFIGLDNIELSLYTSPPLSTVNIPKTDIGSLAARTIVDSIQGKCPAAFRIVLPVNIIERESSSHSRKPL